MVEAMRPALAFVEALTGPHASLACQGDAALIFRRFGQALVLKDAAAATEAFQNSLFITQAIAKAAPDDREAQFNVLEARAWLARSYVLTPRVDVALATYQGVLEPLQRLLADGHGSPDWADLLAQVSTEYGGYQAVLGKTTEALATQEAIRSTAARMADAQPEAAPWQHAVIVSQLEIAKLRAVLHQPDQEGAALEDAVSRAERVAALPQQPEGRLADLLETRRRRGDYELATKAPDAALADLRAALSLAEELSAAEPASTRWPAARAQVQVLLARATEMIGSPAGTPGNGAPPP
jgi:tetratricopeptide (TPR) repeat protein